MLKSCIVHVENDVSDKNLTVDNEKVTGTSN